MRTRLRRARTLELWKINRRLGLGVETQDSIAWLLGRRAWLIGKLGGERPWGLRSPTADSVGCNGMKGAGA